MLPHLIIIWIQASKIVIFAWLTAPRSSARAWYQSNLRKIDSTLMLKCEMFCNAMVQWIRRKQFRCFYANETLDDLGHFLPKWQSRFIFSEIYVPSLTASHFFCSLKTCVAWRHDLLTRNFALEREDVKTAEEARVSKQKKSARCSRAY